MKKFTIFTKIREIFSSRKPAAVMSDKPSADSMTHVTAIPFSSFELQPELHKALQTLGFKYTTQIQAAALPKALAGCNIMGQGKTGTGKTVAFLLATFQRLLSTPKKSTANKPGPRALILAPTRELAMQIYADGLAISKFSKLKLAVLYGGVGYGKQKSQFDEVPDVVIGTPGRVIDLFKQRLFHFSDIDVMVFDEADRMFDLGFIKDMRFILRRLPDPRTRLNLLFSATFTLRVTELAYEHMDNPEIITTGDDKKVADRIEEILYCPANDEKLPLLIGLLKKTAPKREIIFVNTKHQAETVYRTLKANGFHAGLLSGDIPQNKRTQLLKDFNDELPILVATDVAARGLHIPEVYTVFNYDIPDDAKDYVHRIGRTARAGAAGVAISFACEKYAHNLTEVFEYLGYQITARNISNEMLADVTRPAPVRHAHQKPKHRQHDKPRRANNHQRAKPSNKHK